MFMCSQTIEPYYEQSRHRRSKNHSHYYSIKKITDEWVDIHMISYIVMLSIDILQ